MKKYEAIIGSRCFDLALPESDTDIAVVGDDWEVRHTLEGKHIMQCPQTHFIDIVTYRKKFIHAHQWLFPAQYLSSGALVSYLLEHRERIITANLSEVWRVNWDTAVSLRQSAEHYYNAFPKRLVYSTLRFETLSRYAAGLPFAEAYKPSRRLHPLLMTMRRGELSISDALRINTEMMKAAEQSADFYKADTDDTFLNTAREELIQLLL